MRVIQRLAWTDNPLTTLKVYEHTLHFRNGVAVIESLTEREINRLRAFGFRVERDVKHSVREATAPVAVEPTPAPEPPAPATTPRPKAKAAARRKE